MKTSSLIFGLLFALIGAISLLTALNGATHQFYVSGLCGFLALILLLDSRTTNVESLKTK